jgi:CxxC motif-containing protein
MIEERQMTCIVCPQGCKLALRINDDTNEIEVFNNRCNRGPAYARKELTNPTRYLTATVAIKNGFHSRLPVKSATEIPKRLNFEMMKVINQIEVEAPVKLGQIIVRNILDTGIDMIATRGMDKKE